MANSFNKFFCFTFPLKIITQLSLKGSTGKTQWNDVITVNAFIRVNMTWCVFVGRKYQQSLTRKVIIQATEIIITSLFGPEEMLHGISFGQFTRVCIVYVVLNILSSLWALNSMLYFTFQMHFFFWHLNNLTARNQFNF